MVPLPVAHGAPLRVRLERKLGYRWPVHRRIELVHELSRIGGGQGDTGKTGLPVHGGI